MQGGVVETEECVFELGKCPLLFVENVSERCLEKCLAPKHDLTQRERSIRLAHGVIPSRIVFGGYGLCVAFKHNALARGFAFDSLASKVRIELVAEDCVENALNVICNQAFKDGDGVAEAVIEHLGVNPFTKWTAKQFAIDYIVEYLLVHSESKSESWCKCWEERHVNYLRSLLVGLDQIETVAFDMMSIYDQACSPSHQSCRENLSHTIRSLKVLIGSLTDVMKMGNQDRSSMDVVAAVYDWINLISPSNVGFEGGRCVGSFEERRLDLMISVALRGWTSATVHFKEWDGYVRTHGLSSEFLLQIPPHLKELSLETVFITKELIYHKAFGLKFIGCSNEYASVSEFAVHYLDFWALAIAHFATYSQPPVFTAPRIRRLNHKEPQVPFPKTLEELLDGQEPISMPHSVSGPGHVNLKCQIMSAWFNYSLDCLLGEYDKALVLDLQTALNKIVKDIHQLILRSYLTELILARSEYYQRISSDALINRILNPEGMGKEPSFRELWQQDSEAQVYLEQNLNALSQPVSTTIFAAGPGRELVLQKHLPKALLGADGEINSQLRDVLNKSGGTFLRHDEKLRYKYQGGYLADNMSRILADYRQSCHNDFICQTINLLKYSEVSLSEMLTDALTKALEYLTKSALDGTRAVAKTRLLALFHCNWREQTKNHYPYPSATQVYYRNSKNQIASLRIFL